MGVLELLCYLVIFWNKMSVRKANGNIVGEENWLWIAFLDLVLGEGNYLWPRLALICRMPSTN